MKVIIPQMSVRTSNCNDMGKLHFEECCIQYNNTLLMSVIFQDQQTWMVIIFHCFWSH